MEERGPALTVVVPVWDDCLHWLGECVGSVWAQRDEVPLRVLVVDNASATAPAGLPDGVLEVLRTARRLSLGAACRCGRSCCCPRSAATTTGASRRRSTGATERSCSAAPRARRAGN